MSTFVAIDFETADPGADSACAVALVRVEGWEVVAKAVRLIRPPRRWIQFSYIHGIEWQHVADQPPFGDVWPQLMPLLDGADQLVAHNAPFDRDVLRACCEAAGPGNADGAVSLYRARSPGGPGTCGRRTCRPCCRFLNIPLNHHDPLSDAEAAARIVIAARKAFPVRAGASATGVTSFSHRR